MLAWWNVADTSETYCCIALKPLRDAQQLLLVMQLSLSALDIPPAARRLIIAPAFHDNVLITATHVFVIGQLPHRPYQVVKSIWINACRIRANRMQPAIAKVAPRRIDAFNRAGG